MEASPNLKKIKQLEKLTTISSAWCARKSSRNLKHVQTARAFSAMIAWSHGSRWTQSALVPIVRNPSGTRLFPNSCKERSTRSILSAMWLVAKRSSLILRSMTTYKSIMLQDNIDAQGQAAMTKKRCMQALMNLFNDIGEPVAKASCLIVLDAVVSSSLITTASITY